MIKTNTPAFKKHFCLTAAGIALQTIGSVCLIAATLVAVKETNEQIKQLLIQKLSK